MTITRSREALLGRLSEAAEVEHNLMCVYLYAAFSLKRGDKAGLSAKQAEAVARWRGEILAVAREEMVHLLLVSNLLTALGGAAHFGRQNFPIPAGSLPADMQVRLAPFDRDTLQHMVWLERPADQSEDMGAGFVPAAHYDRAIQGDESKRLMPHAMDYATVGVLYAQIEKDLDNLANSLGEDGLFIGDKDAQIGPDLIGMPGVTKVLCLKTAHAALQGIVAQGEGAQETKGQSHYQRFCAMRSEYDALLAEDAGFVPGWPAANNPVMRRPPTPEGKVHISAPAAAEVVDLANALYAHMLRLLVQAFGRTADSGEKTALIDGAVDLMFAMTPVAELAARLPARDPADGVNAGMSFATLRSFQRIPDGHAEWQVLSERMQDLAKVALALSENHLDLVTMATSLTQASARFASKALAFSNAPVANTPAAGVTLIAPRKPPVSTQENGVERADGTKLTILFEAKRCIHARFCVTGLPGVFKANVQGPWIDPDAASTEALVGVAHACPSGAILYMRNDGGDEEVPPAVNIARIRENGPYAIHADIELAGKGSLTRATLCRCGKSKNKPFCDNSHIEAGFLATGEPANRDSEPLAVRGGTLEITPQTNGPLIMRGPLEICAGTGHTVDRIMSTRLCRCGGSKTKPFCDNSHLTNGFSSEN